MKIVTEPIIVKVIKAYSEQNAKNQIKAKYKYARLICYKFMEDFRLKKGDFKDRKMKVAFIKNYKNIIED